MIALFTDFGLRDPYVGQVHAVLAREAAGVPVIDLFHAVPDFDIQAAAYLLPAYTTGLPAASVVMAVVDPGVGGARKPLMLLADDVWYVGPDNGLFELLARRSKRLECFEILWQPPQLSHSFHGRDWFAPVAAQLAMGSRPASQTTILTAPIDPWPDDLARVIYIDHYGNLVTAMRADSVDSKSRVRIGGQVIGYARVFGEVAQGQAFWYSNANGLIEIAVNQGRADRQLQVTLGDSFELS